ncbi:hypothetical protein JCM11641_001623 [Rhodosporidiobolus odoratus]
MYRSPYDNRRNSDPRGLSRPSTSRNFPLFTSRTRIHPVVLLPVFLFGAVLSPFLHFHFVPTVPEPRYRPQDYDYKPQDVFAEPDAPPLVVEDDRPRANKPAKDDKVMARDGHGEGADEWGWWDPSTSPSSDDSSPPFALIHSGLLYFSSSPSTVPTLSSHPHPFPLAKPDTARRPARPKMPDQGLTLPPSPPMSWLAPGQLFAHPPGRRKHALDHSAPVDLHAPLPPAPARRNPALHPLQQRQQRQQPAGRAVFGQDRYQRRKPAEKDAAGHVLGPNAAAMARAKREGKPFVPGKPAELAEEEALFRSKQKKEAARKLALENKQKGVMWQQGGAKEQGVEKVVGGEDDEEEEQDGEGDDSLALRDDDELLDIVEEEGDLAEQVGDIDPDDDSALLAAIRLLSPDELKELSPSERELVQELEAAEAAGRAAGQQKKQRPRQKWQDRDPLEVVPHREAPRAPPPKPVFRGPAGQDRKGHAAGAGRGLRKRSFGTEESNEPVQDTNDSLAPSASSGDTISTPSSVPSAETSSNLTRRALTSHLSDGRSAPQDRLHPMSHLISRAEEEWDTLLRKQSQTLDQAVEEYKARYKMNPPAGFDAWWRYAMQNRIVLVDEYDQIYDDLLPFFSLPPSELRRRAASLHTDSALPWHSHSFGINIKDGSVSLKQGQNSDSGAGRSEDLLDILGEFAEMLPDLELRFAEGDEPAVVISGEARERHEQFAKQGKLLGFSESFEVLEPTGFTAWDALCPPNSTARRLAQALPVDTPSGNNLRSFVSIEHPQAMDPCANPALRSINGFTSSSTGPRPHVLYPLFSFSKTSVHADILVPSISNDYYVEVGRDPTWEQKKHNKVLWRGETTGAYHARGTGWRQTQRPRLVELANANVGKTTLHLASLNSDDALRRLTVSTHDLTQHYFDVAFSGKPTQCSQKDKTCALLAHEFRFDSTAKVSTPDDENQYKYVVDVDANYPSGKFKRAMSSRSLVFKSTIFPEWWSRRVMPWYHYIPLKPDYSDLIDLSAFFIGLPDGTGSHDHLAKKIAAQGKKWADEQWREVDMAAYMFRLYLEYARLLNRDGDNLQSMDYST